MIVLLDSDVLLDVALDREPWNVHSGEALRLCQRNALTGFVSWHSLANVFYLIKRADGGDGRLFIAPLLRFVQVAAVGHGDMVLALKLDLPDLEDAMQIAAAVACSADRIVTRNTGDFSKSPVPAVTPAELLEELRAERGSP